MFVYEECLFVYEVVEASNSVEVTCLSYLCHYAYREQSRKPTTITQPATSD